MKFDVYGRFQIEVRREDDGWVAYQIALGKRTRVTLFAIPQEIQTSAEIARYLDDMHHEAARPGQSVSVVPEWTSPAAQLPDNAFWNCALCNIELTVLTIASERAS